MELRAVISDKEAFLAHHGVKGMKWGVHNEETQRKYGELQSTASAGGGGIVVKDPNKLKYNDVDEPANFDEVGEALKELGFTQEQIDKMDKFSDRFSAWSSAYTEISENYELRKPGKQSVGGNANAREKAEINSIKNTNPMSRTVKEQERLDKYLGHSVVDDLFLAHHGVRGMKWGVHNEETQRKYGEDSGEGIGGGGIDTETLKRKSLGEELEDQAMAALYDLISNGPSRLAEAAKDLVNQHLSDIESGDIARGEAQVIAVINAVTKMATGENVINNPAGKPASFQDKEEKVRI